MFIGEAASLGAAFSWAVAVCLFRAHGHAFPAEFANLYKCTLGLVCTGLAILALGVAFPQDSQAWLGLAASGLFGLALGDTAFFASLPRLGAQLSSALQTLSPPFAAVIAFFFLGEHLRMEEILGMVITSLALLGAIWFSQRDSQGDGLKLTSRNVLISGVLLAGVAALMQAVGLVLSRVYMKDVHILYGSLMRLLPSVGVLIAWNYVRSMKARKIDPKKHEANFLPTTGHRQWIWVAVAAVVGTFVGTLLVSYGIKHSKVAVSSVLSSLYPLWVVPIAWTFLGEKTNRATVCCIVVAVGGMCLMFV